MIKKILLGLAVALLALAGFIASRPSTFLVQRTVTMKSAPKYVFPSLNSFYRWADWSSWNDLDPAMKRTYEGPVVGVGSVYAWDGDSTVGKGRMTLEESRKDELIRIKLETHRPFPSTSTLTFTLKPVPEGVSVTWALEGHYGFMGKASSLLLSMDERATKDLDAGLARLRMLAEAKAEEKAQEAAADAAVLKAMAEATAAPASGLPAARP